MEISKTYHVIEVIRIYYSGDEKILRIINLDDIYSINANYDDKSIDIYLKTVDSNGFNERLSFKDEDLSYINIHFSYITRIN